MNHTQIILKSSYQLTADRLMNHVEILAAPNMRGRMPGDIGYARACDYVEKIFSHLKLKPGGDQGSYRQTFRLETNWIVSASARLKRQSNQSQLLELGQDFVCRGLSGDGKVEGPLVFVGYGRQDEHIDELGNVDLTGKIAVSFKQPPIWLQNSSSDLPRAKAHRLRDRGAVGLVIIPNPNHPERDRLSASLMETNEQIPGFPMIVLSENTAMNLMNFNNQTLASRQYQIDQFRQCASCDIPASIAIHLETVWHREGICWNLVGILPGSDPDLRQEAIIIGAHLDHVGIQGEKVIFHGAQDDASGVASMLEMARVFSQGTPPRRSLIFIAFGAEETGIVGSLFYGKHPSWPMEQTIAMLNMDCIGAGIGLDVRGRKHHSHLFDIMDYWNDNHIKIPDTHADHVAGGADAEAFQQAGVPNMFFVSQKPYDHLHMATDTPETLNPFIFEAISRLAFLTASRLTHTTHR